MNAYERHVQLMNNFVLFYNRDKSLLQPVTLQHKTEWDALVENHR
jgi:hypothetical protein